MKIVIVNSGLGNVKSIQNVIAKIGYTGEIIDNPNDLRDAERIVLPGVGKFDSGMKHLEDGSWINELNNAVLERNIPVLGICLGMQLMCMSSEEGSMQGLGWIDAKVKKIQNFEDPNIKIPHMGWNTLNIKKDNKIFKNQSEKNRYYFVHSYYVDCSKDTDVIATTFYGSEIAVAFNKNNIYGVQFHPEKSHRFGMELFKSFLDS